MIQPAVARHATSLFPGAVPLIGSDECKRLTILTYQQQKIKAAIETKDVASHSLNRFMSLD